MDMYRIPDLLRGGARIEDLNLRVTFYARVSSEKDEQLNSLSNQISYYKEKIQRNPNWTYVDGYIDEGISGISTKKRENFNRMIDDASIGLFDIIITKEISRFARNTLDSISFTRKLHSYGVAVIFENDGIRTYEPDSELRLTIMSSIAQDELRKLSSRIKFGHKQAIKSNVVLGNNNIFGYKKHNKHLIIDEKEAEMVRELYTLYATDRYSLRQIEIMFWEKGYRNRKGKKIMHSTMAGIIANPKYKGYYVGGKVVIVDMFTKKQKFLPPEEWVMHKDETGEIVPAIIDEKTWEDANEILERRSNDVKQRKGVCSHHNLLTGKLICAHCGLPYYRKDSMKKTGEANSRWVCSGKIKKLVNENGPCPSFTITEEDIKPIIFEIFKDTSEDSKRIVKEYTQMFKEFQSNGTLKRIIANYEAKIAELKNKQDNLITLYSTQALSREQYKEMNADYQDQRIALLKELESTKKTLVSEEEFNKRMADIKRVLEEASCGNDFRIITKEFINKFIDKIIVTPVDAYTARLEIKLRTDKNCESYLQKLRRGTCVFTSKKMVESYENSIKGTK